MTAPKAAWRPASESPREMLGRTGGRSSKPLMYLARTAASRGTGGPAHPVWQGQTSSQLQLSIQLRQLIASPWNGCGNRRLRRTELVRRGD